MRKKPHKPLYTLDMKWLLCLSVCPRLRHWKMHIWHLEYFRVKERKTTIEKTREKKKNNSSRDTDRVYAVEKTCLRLGVRMCLYDCCEKEPDKRIWPKFNQRNRSIYANNLKNRWLRLHKPQCQHRITSNISKTCAFENGQRISTCSNVGTNVLWQAFVVVVLVLCYVFRRSGMKCKPNVCLSECIWVYVCVCRIFFSTLRSPH